MQNATQVSPHARREEDVTTGDHGGVISGSDMADTWDDAALRILVIDDEANIRVTLAMCLEAQGHLVAPHGTIEDALAAVAKQAFDLVFLDVRLGVHNGLD